MDMAARQAGITDRLARQRVCYIWPEVVGPAVGRQTSRRWIDGSVLHVTILSAALRGELSYLRTSLIDKLNAAAGAPGAITDIIFH